MRKTLLLIALATLTSCATITSSTKQEVSINVKPDHAKVYVNGSKVGEGSCTAEVPVKKRNTIVVKADGYENAQIKTNRQIRPGYLIGNIAMCFVPMVNFFGIPSLITDACTGAWYKQDETEYYFDLDKK
jgi:hypothetical protein